MELSQLHCTLFQSCSRFRVIERNIIGNKMKFVTECILCCCVGSTFRIGVACNCVFVTFVQLLSLGINSLKGENQRHPRQMVILFDSPKGLDSNGKATNNGAEAFHRHFGDLFGYLRCKPSLFHFLRIISRVNTLKDIKLRSTQKTVSQRNCDKDAQLFKSKRKT